ncbi:hypothetical protein F2P56_022027 [Juglans regia]|uniref:mitogen-activated protein kinase kinase kinase n=2 Tax=Juglans regia TaxID=51240 RepID=A0A2I4GLG2_JUGRE|nr:mitogen-activated protein kinase kinase kinase 3-like [Juglans regia]KAF5457957.1 hypothetical protein F2P56_022027 [Juglans regia]
MSAWWGRKCSKNKGIQKQQVVYHDSLRTHPLNLSKSSNKNDNTKGKDKETPTSLVNDFDGYSVFSGFDSDSGDRSGHPLPRWSTSFLFWCCCCPTSSVKDHIPGAAVGMGSRSGSFSGVSTSWSSDDQPVSQENGQFGDFRGQGDTKINVRSRSPGQGSSGPTSQTSLIHPRLSDLSLESLTVKQEGRKSQFFHLPLPVSPVSPTILSALPNTNISGGIKSTTSTQSQWKKERLLGRGTFGDVYVGFNSENGNICAIKEVRAGCDDQISRACLKQLNQEINLLSQLSHPNICQYYGSELGEETLSVYMEYVYGGSIHKLLEEYGSFNESAIQNYTWQIISGLAYLHGINTVHRDIKGANILVNVNGEIKLADFGMAKHLTGCFSMLSKPYWKAPEVITNTNGPSLAGDIWSVGCTVLEMATSKPPWGQYEQAAAMFKILNRKDGPEIPEHLSNDARNFIKLCLQRDPTARPTALQLLHHPFIRDQATRIGWQI